MRDLILGAIEQWRLHGSHDWLKDGRYSLAGWHDGNPFPPKDVMAVVWRCKNAEIHTHDAVAALEKAGFLVTPKP